MRSLGGDKRAAHQRSSRSRARVRAAVNDDGAVDDSVGNADRVRLRFLERVGLADGGGIKDDEVGSEALADLTAIAKAKDLRGATCHLADGVRSRQHPLTAAVRPVHAR